MSRTPLPTVASDAVDRGFAALRRRYPDSGTVPMSAEVAAFAASTTAPARAGWVAKATALFSLVGLKTMLGAAAAAALGLGGAHAVGVVDLPVLPPVVANEPATLVEIEAPAVQPDTPTDAPASQGADPHGDDGLVLPAPAAPPARAAVEDVQPGPGDPVASVPADEPDSQAPLEETDPGDSDDPDVDGGGDTEPEGGDGPGLGAWVSEQARDGVPQEDGRAFGEAVSDAAHDREARGLPDTPRPDDSTEGDSESGTDEAATDSDESAPGRSGDAPKPGEPGPPEGEVPGGGVDNRPDERPGNAPDDDRPGNGSSNRPDNSGPANRP